MEVVTSQELRDFTEKGDREKNQYFFSRTEKASGFYLEYKTNVTFKVVSMIVFRCNDNTQFKLNQIRCKT